MAFIARQQRIKLAAPGPSFGYGTVAARLRDKTLVFSRRPAKDRAA
jgi:hypothetical protein